MASKSPSLLFLLLAASSLLSTTANFDAPGLAKDADFIDELPNQPESADFRQYAGYIVVEPINERRYFYYFVEATGLNPASKPLILYIGTHGTLLLFSHDKKVVDLQGSALLSAFQQVGPYSVGDDGQTLYSSPYSWNKFANVLFMEGPVGVGFSVSSNGQDIYKCSDLQLIDETYKFLLGWMQRFPEHRNADIYLAGQSYAGVLGPGVATYILFKNSQPNATHVNVRGILMGNPTLDVDLEFAVRVDSSYQMNIISEEIRDEHHRLCGSRDPAKYTDCLKPLQEESLARYALDDNSVYAKFCPNIDLASVGLDNFKTTVYDCVDQYVAGYLNIPFVQGVMHAEGPAWGPAIWQPYARSLEFSRNITDSTIFLLRALGEGVRALIYSGVLDGEAIIPTEEYIKKLNFTIASEWRPWFDNSVQVAGFTETYREGLTYATVRGAGKKVMADKPRCGFILANSFVTNSHLPRSNFELPV
ncbi:hypothetical protein HPP92_013958 [Vanilla planifolia]|uniref:Uncharacterized protein n=1 Tax=Vanilla planifolia TaxID=51239 RepID=A0A835QSX7_VANPL|nr:hypothetical protein HPP92_013958 [Vanilla planifolia]